MKVYASQEHEVDPNAIDQLMDPVWVPPQDLIRVIDDDLDYWFCVHSNL